MAATPKQHGREGKADVVRLLLQRESAGLRLNAMAVKQEDLRLFVAAIRNFRTWRETLRAAGVNPESVALKRTWTPGRVIQRIQELELQGVPMNQKSAKTIDSGLSQAARRYWGSWDEALLEAGVDAVSIRRHRSPWTRSTLIEAIQAHAASGARVTRNAMRPRSVGKAACRLFGSFDAALEAAGVLDQRNLPPEWSRAKVLTAIRRRREKGEPISSAEVIRADQPLYDAARRYLGGWNQALRAAGVDPRSVRAIRPEWTRDDIIEELRRRVEAGVRPTSVSSIRPISLVKACRKFFGSCEAAAIAAGVEPAKIGYFRSPSNGLRRPAKAMPKR